jgi:hypothetical protein
MSSLAPMRSARSWSPAGARLLPRPGDAEKAGVLVVAPPRFCIPISRSWTGDCSTSCYHGQSNGVSQFTFPQLRHLRGTLFGHPGSNRPPRPSAP